jgi:hypothetical protein
MTGNAAAIMSGKLFPQIKKLVENLKPEGFYSGVAKGQRHDTWWWTSPLSINSPGL